MIRNTNRLIALSMTIFLICLFSFCKKSSGNNSTNPPSDTASYQLIWADEFDEPAIKTDTWNFETGGSGWGNNELEYYQQQNAGIEDGNLVITAKKETVGSNNYTSSRMTTQGKKEFKYGKIEARMKLPLGKGFWPAFWMLGSNINMVSWPACGETDIMEHINEDSIIHGTAHWDDGGHQQNEGNTASTPSQYHVYSIEWTKDAITWFLDSVQFHKVAIIQANTSEFQQASFIILNFAIGGNWPGFTIDDNLLPAKLYVDYVRVYQKK